MGHASTVDKRVERHRLIVDAVRNGMAVTDAGRTYGLSVAAASRACKAAGVSPSQSKYRVASLERVLLALIEDGQKMIGAVYRTKEQAELYAEACALLAHKQDR